LQDQTSPTNVSEIGQLNFSEIKNFVGSQNLGRGDVRSQQKLENRQEKALLPQEKCKTDKKACLGFVFLQHNLFMFFLFSNFCAIFFLEQNYF